MSRKRANKRMITVGMGILLVVITSLVQQYGPKQAATPTPAPTPAAPTTPVPPGYYHVTQFADGDTISVDMDGKQERVRMIGVDTPETHDPRKPVQCFGQAAADFTKGFLGHSAVRLEADPLNTNRDRYDRLLRYVYLPDGSMVNAEIIKRGYGFAYTSFPFTKADEFRALETQARQDKQGLWASCQTTTTKSGQVQSSAIERQ